MTLTPSRRVHRERSGDPVAEKLRVLPLRGDRHPAGAFCREIHSAVLRRDFRKRRIGHGEHDVVRNAPYNIRTVRAPESESGRARGERAVRIPDAADSVHTAYPPCRSVLREHEVGVPFDYKYGAHVREFLSAAVCDEERKHSLSGRESAQGARPVVRVLRRDLGRAAFQFEAVTDVAAVQSGHRGVSEQRLRLLHEHVRVPVLESAVDLRVLFRKNERDAPDLSARRKRERRAAARRRDVLRKHDAYGILSPFLRKHVRGGGFYPVRKRGGNVHRRPAFRIYDGAIRACRKAHRHFLVRAALSRESVAGHGDQHTHGPAAVRGRRHIHRQHISAGQFRLRAAGNRMHRKAALRPVFSVRRSGIPCVDRYGRGLRIRFENVGSERQSQLVIRILRGRLLRRVLRAVSTDGVYVRAEGFGADHVDDDARAVTAVVRDCGDAHHSGALRHHEPVIFHPTSPCGLPSTEESSRSYPLSAAPRGSTSTRRYSSYSYSARSIVSTPSSAPERMRTPDTGMATDTDAVPGKRAA